ncbi:MAG: alpha/beta hydrolase [Bacteroidia bacterium]|nr:alpha/beta hydrolase [Bacteroidia bacterium]
MLNKVVIDNINIYTRGDVRNGALVFIHGNSLSAITFKKQFELLPDYIPLVAFDLPGHGLSARHDDYEDVYCIPGYIRSLQTVIKSLQLDNFILVGHSLGGHIAIQASENIKGLKGLMVFGTPPIGMPPEMDQMFLPNPQMSLLFSNTINSEDALKLSAEFIHSNTELIAELAEIITTTDGKARENLGVSISKGQFSNEKEILNNFKAPIAILQGENERFVNALYLNNLDIPSLWKKNIIQITGAGHIPQMENTKEFNSAISELYSHVF